MNEFTVATHMQDAKQLLSSTGFATSNVWYHGTASGLVDAITAEGLRGTGDLELLGRHLQTLGTIGHDSSDHRDPLFVTQSKELAFFWATQKAHTRSMYLKTQETPVVFELTLPDDLNKQVITDAGGAALLLEPNNNYIAWLNGVYEACGFSAPNVDPFQCDRLDFLNKLGLAYINVDVPAQYIKQV